MARAAAGEAAFEFQGQRYTLVFDFAAIAEFEDASGQSIIDAFAELNDAQAANRSPKISTLVHLLAAGLTSHHGPQDRNHVLAMVGDAEVMAALVGSTGRSMPDTPADGADPLAAAPRKSGARGTGTKSAAAGAKRAKASNPSGGQRRANS